MGHFGKYTNRRLFKGGVYRLNLSWFKAGIPFTTTSRHHHHLKNDITLAAIAGGCVSPSPEPRTLTPSLDSAITRLSDSSCPPPIRRSVAPKPPSAADYCFRFTDIYLRQQSILLTFINYRFVSLPEYLGHVYYIT